MKSRAITLAVLACVVVSACTKPVQHTAHRVVHSPSPVAGISPSPALPAPPPIHWTACSPAGWQCGHVSVPIDYADPTGPTLAIAVNRHPATDPAHRIGSLLVNPGGPGISGTSFAVNDFSAWSGLEPYFDIVGFDPRGVGESQPIKCLSDGQMDAFNAADAVPDDGGELSTLTSEAQQMASGCQKNGALLAHVDTASAARDLDELRMAVGDQKLTYLGYSYGTYLGHFYAHLFPTHVRALVLDGVVDTNIDESSLTVIQAQGFEKNLDDYLAACPHSQPACPFTGSSPKSQLLAFLERLDANPLPVGARSLNSTLALTGILLALYDTSSWPYLTQALNDAEAGNGGVLLRLADIYTERDNNGHYSNSIESNYAINCLDHPLPDTSDAYFAQRAQHLAQVAPVMGPFVAYSDLPCKFWPAAPTNTPAALDAVGAPPIVLVGTSNDPATPYAWAQAVRHELSSSVLITRNGDGHTSYDVSACVRSYANAYFIDLKVPPDGAVCT
ncbi:MAG TPA: alpha/beta hydrolase [Candidatus Dormibacteraeota bacterium]